MDRPAGLEEEHWLCATSAQRRQSQTLTEREQRQIFSFLSLPTFYLLPETCGANTFKFTFSSLDDFIIPKTNSPSLGRTVLQLLSPAPIPSVRGPESPTAQKLCQPTVGGIKTSIMGIWRSTSQPASQLNARRTLIETSVCVTLSEPILQGL